MCERQKCPWCKRFAKVEKTDTYTDIICKRCGVARFS